MVLGVKELRSGGIAAVLAAPGCDQSAEGLTDAGVGAERRNHRLEGHVRGAAVSGPRATRGAVSDVAGRLRRPERVFVVDLRADEQVARSAGRDFVGGAGLL